MIFAMDDDTGDYFSNLTTIALLSVRNDILLMRSFACAQNDMVLSFKSGECE